MTVSTTDNTQSYTGDGSTTVFAFPFLTFEEDHLTITIDGVSTSAWSATGYGDEAGIEVTFDSAPADQSAIIMQRLVPYDQQTDLENFDGNPADVTEKQFDLIVMQTQQLNEELGRTSKVPVGSSGLTLPVYSAGLVPYWSTTTADTQDNSTKTMADIEGAVDAVAALSAASGVKVSSDDTTVGFLNGKLIAGTNVTFTENNPGGSETLTIDVSASSAPVDSVFGRTGIVVAASGDYGSDEVTNDSGVTGATVSAALDQLDTDIGAIPTSSWTYVTPVTPGGGSFTIASGLPSTVTEVEIFFSDATGANAVIKIELGDSGGFETTGYKSRCISVTNTGTHSFLYETSGFAIMQGASGSEGQSGVIRINKYKDSANKWICDSVLYEGNASLSDKHSQGGDKTLSGVLTQIRATRNGGGNWSGGEVTLRYK